MTGGRLAKRHLLAWRSVASSLAALLVLAVPLTLATGAAAESAAATLPRIEPQVMCVTCRIPLNTAESPQANVEREYIKSLIRKGYDESRIKKALVGQYGPAVLALPGAKGFNLAAYLVPLAVVLALLALLVILLPRWRRAARSAPDGASAPVPSLSAADAERLRQDMAQFD